MTRPTPPDDQPRDDTRTDDSAGETTDLASLPVTPEARAAAEEEGSPLPRFWAGIKRLPKYARVAASLIADKDVPPKSKAMLGLGGAYLASPIDLVPGVIPVAGQLDDLYVLLRALRQALHSAAPEVSARHLHAVGLTMANVEDDIKAIEDTTIWLVKQGISKGSQAASVGLRKGQDAASAGLKVGTDVATAGWKAGSAAATSGLKRVRGMLGKDAEPADTSDEGDPARPPGLDIEPTT